MNQPKYRKFVATAASAALVASVVAPVASAAETSNLKDIDGHRHEAAIKALVKENVISGFPDGTFRPDTAVTREQAAIFVARALGLMDGKDLPANPFTDVSETSRAYEAIVKLRDKGIVNGFTETEFKPEEVVNRGQMAIMLAKAYELELGTAADTTFEDVTENVKAAPYIAAVVNAGIALGYSPEKFGVTDDMKRGDFAKMTYNSMVYAGDIEEETAELTVESVSAINAKSLQVTFNKEVDTTKAVFAVKKGTITANVAKVTFADDKKSATLELSSKLTKGDYTVSVTGLTEETLVKTVSVENEKVAGIEILSENAVLNASDAGKVSVGYKVVNQYGEDITKTATGLTVTSNVTGAGSSTVEDPTNGVVNITNATGVNFKSGDKISLSILDATTSTFTSKVLTVSDKAAVSEVAITGMFNDVDNKEVLTTDATYTDFHLLVNAKDQYGQEIPFGNISGDVIVTTSDSTVVDVKGGVATPTFEQLTIDGKKQSVLELKAPATPKAGKATISIISKTSGKVAQFVVEVQEGVKADAVTLSAPELAVAGEKTDIPFSVLGLDGTEITKATVLNGSKGVTLSDNDNDATVAFVNDTKTGKAKLVLDDTQGSPDRTKDRKVMITATSANGKVATLFVDIKAKAEAKVITATKEVVTNLAVGGSFDLNKSNVVVKDQYGRDFDLTGKLAPKAPAAESGPGVGDSTDAGKYLVKVEKADSTADKVSLSTDKLIASDNTDVTVTGDKKGSEVVKLTLQQVDAAGVAKNVISSELDINVKVADKASIVSYEVKDVAPIYDEPTGTVGEGYTRDLIVYGVLADGTKVVVPATEYTVVTSNSKLNYTAGKLDVKVADDIVGTDNKDVSVNVKVIVNASEGPVIIDKAVTITNAAPKAMEIELKTAGGVTVADNVLTGAIADVTASAKLKGVLKITDQYGEDISSSAAITLTATNLVNSDKDDTVPSVTGNGTSTLTFTNVEADDSFNLTYVIDGKTLTVKVIAE